MTTPPPNPREQHPHFPSEKAQPSTSAKWAAFLEAEMRQQFPEMFKETKP